MTLILWNLTAWQIFGKNDTHVPPEGRDLIRKTLHDKGVLFGFYEVAWAQRTYCMRHISSGEADNDR